jgi:hypothetical protein
LPPAADPDLRAKLDVVFEAGPALEAARGQTSAKLLAEGDGLLADIRKQHGAASKPALPRKARAGRLAASEPSLAAGIDVAIAIVEDGISTIYAPRHPFYVRLGDRSGFTPFVHGEQTHQQRPETDDVADQDIDGAVKGAIADGVGGAAVGGVTDVRIGVGAVGGGFVGGVAGAAIKPGGKIVDVIGDW